jgi:hypothetical protein
MNPNTKKQHRSRKDNTSNKTSTMDVTNEPKTSNDIIDIDDSPDVATWNKEVTRNKDHIAKDIKISEETKNKYRITKIHPEIPPTTTIGLRREDNDNKDNQVDPANQKDVDRIYNSGGKLTDDANLFNNKRKYTRNQKGK